MRTTVAVVALSGLLSAGALAQDHGTVTSDDLYENFKRAFQSRGGAKHFRIGVAAARGITAPGRVTCSTELDLPAGGVEITCENLKGPADVFLVDNQAVQGDSVLPEAHDTITRVGRLEARPDGTAKVGSQLGADFFSDSEVDLVVLVPPGGDPTAQRQLLALGGPSAFMRKFWRETRRGGPRSRGFGRQRRGRGFPRHFPGGEPEDLTDDPRIRLGLVDEDILQGAELFFREDFDGNGRTCASCHRAEANLGLDPDFVQRLLRGELRRFRGLKDPLFVAHPRFIGRHPVSELEVPVLLNQQAMILENVDGFDSPAEKFVMRGVPHALSQAPTIAASAPRGDGTLPDGSSPDVVERTGWSGDGAPVTGALRLFPVGAAIQHFRRQFDNQTPGPGNFRLPDDEELDQMERFMLTTGRTRDIDLDALVFRDPEAEGGRGAFTAGACGLCHSNAGAIARADIVEDDLEGRDGDDLGNRNFDTRVERLDTPARQAYLERTGLELTCDGGFGGQGLGLDGHNLDSDCGLGQDTGAEGDGIDNPDAFGDGRFNAVSLIESADTGPFFHNNAVDTIEEAVAFYRSAAFNTSPAAVRFQVDLSGLSDTAVINVAATLRTLNAGFNLRLAEQRCAAAAAILAEAEHGFRRGDRKARKVVDGLIELAREELVDARRVLSRRDAEIDDVALDLEPLYPGVRRDVRRVLTSTGRLLRARSARGRLKLAEACQSRSQAARESLTAADSAAVLDFEMGAGNLAF